MSAPPWAKDEFPECSTADFLTVMHIAREGIVLSRRFEAVKIAGRNSEYEPYYQRLRRLFFCAEVHDHEDEEKAPEVTHAEAAVRFCELVGRERIQRGLLASLIGRYLLQEYRSRFVAKDTDIAFHDGCCELGFAAETHLYYLASLTADRREHCVERIDAVIDTPGLPKRVAVLRDAFGETLSESSDARSVCERILALSVSARYLQYVEKATLGNPNSGMKEPIDRDTMQRLRVVIREGGSDVAISLITAVHIAEHLEYEDLRSKSLKTESVIENAAGYVRNTDDLIHKRHITGMRQVIQSLLQARRKDGVNIAAERFAQLFRITNPDFISWNLSKVDLQKYYKIIRAAGDPEPAETVSV